jgi:hypothetical protein
MTKNIDAAITIDPERLAELESHSKMLGIIGSWVEDFAVNSEDTTLNCVLRLLEEYYLLKSNEAADAISRQIKS